MTVAAIVRMAQEGRLDLNLGERRLIFLVDGVA